LPEAALKGAVFSFERRKPWRRYAAGAFYLEALSEAGHRPRRPAAAFHLKAILLPRKVALCLALLFNRFAKPAKVLGAFFAGKMPWLRTPQLMPKRASCGLFAR
jgi:hypothetical protein